MGNNLENTKIQWHSGFYGAAELEFGSDKEVLEFNREYNLSKGILKDYFPIPSLLKKR